MLNGQSGGLLRLLTLQAAQASIVFRSPVLVIGCHLHAISPMRRSSPVCAGNHTNTYCNIIVLLHIIANMMRGQSASARAWNPLEDGSSRE